MKVLIIYRHYWPGTRPLGDMLRTLAEDLTARGHRVTVFSAYPDPRNSAIPRREFKSGVRIVRARVPQPGGPVTIIAAAALFMAQAFAYAARHRFDLVWTESLPPIVNGVVGVLSARAAGARFLYHVHSVHPEALAVVGLVTTPFVLRALSKIDSWTCRLSDAVVVISDDMMRTIADRGGNGAVAFHVMADFMPSDPEPPVVSENHDIWRLAFYGSFGRGQDLGRLLEAMALIDPAEGIGLDIIASTASSPDSRVRTALEKLPHVRYVAPAGAGKAGPLVARADAGAIVLRRGLYRVGFSSKLMTYLARGLPILALVESDSTLAAYIADHRIGVAVDGDAAMLANAIRRLRQTYPATSSQRRRLAGLARRDFGRAAACARWAELVESLGAD